MEKTPVKAKAVGGKPGTNEPGANKHVKSHYHGIFVTETILGNPNGSFTGNEPRNIEGRVYTTDKCIKYNVRLYITGAKERVGVDSSGKVTSVENFVFFFPRKTADAAEGESSFMTKETVFETYLGKDSKRVFECPDVRMFGGTFSFRNEKKKKKSAPPTEDEEEGGGGSFNIHGPIQVSYGLDLIGASIINHQVGTPFANKDGDQKTIGESSIVDHAVIAYDIEVNPNSYKDLLTEGDLALFSEAIVGGTNLRRSTSKHTVPKLLIMMEFKDGPPNIGELKQFISIKSPKIVEFTPGPHDLKIDLGAVKKRLADLGYGNVPMTTWKDPNVELVNWP